MVSVFPVCHWGNLGHKGRWIGVGSLIMGIGTIVCALPHYFIAPYVPDQHTNGSNFGQCLARLVLLFTQYRMLQNYWGSFCSVKVHLTYLWMRLKEVTHVIRAFCIQSTFSEPESKSCLSIDEGTSSPYLNPYFLLFILGQTFNGIGSTPLVD